MNKVLKKTALHFGDGWNKGKNREINLNSKWHFDKVVKIFNFPNKMEGIGLEAGCGGGRDTLRIAQANPNSTIFAVDISEGAIITSELLKKFSINNVKVFREDLANISLKDESVDWCYSFGVLHHLESPDEGLKEINRVMKPGGKIITYLYSDLREYPFLRIPLLFINSFRAVTTRLPLGFLNIFCWILAIPIYFFITKPCMLMNITFLPYTSEKDIKQVWGGLHDRFGAQIEKRYNPISLKNFYKRNGFKMTQCKQIKGWRGWVSLAQKVN